MLNFAICEDNELTRKQFIELLNKVILKHNIVASVVFDTSEPSEFLKFVLLNKVDAVFIDIDLNSSINGMDIAEKIRKVNKNINIIFTTAHFEYSLLSYKFITFDYLVKPILTKKLEECILRLSDYIDCSDKSVINVKTAGKTYLVKSDDILCIEKVGAKSYIYTSSQVVESNLSLEDFEKMLGLNFIRIHKSYIINIKNTRQVDTVNNFVYTNGDYKCYIGRKYKKEFMEVLRENGIN